MKCLRFCDDTGRGEQLTAEMCRPKCKAIWRKQLKINGNDVSSLSMNWEHLQISIYKIFVGHLILFLLFFFAF